MMVERGGLTVADLSGVTIKSARAPERQSARAPERQSARAPERQSARAPERQSARAPERQSARAPERQSCARSAPDGRSVVTAPSASHGSSSSPSERPPARAGRRPPPLLSRFRPLALPRLAPLAACLLAAALFLLPGTQTAEAQTTVKLVSNTGQTAESRATSVFGYFGGNCWMVAQRFTTGSFSFGYLLSAVDVAVDSIGRSSAARVSIYTTSAGAVGRSLYVLSGPAALAGNALNRVTAPPNARLSANTEYAVALEEASGGSTTPRGVMHW